MLPLLPWLAPAHACTRAEGPPPTRYAEFRSPSGEWLGEFDRTEGVVRGYRTADPFHALWTASLPAADPARSGVAVTILDNGVVVLVRERGVRPEQPVVTIARSTGTRTWTATELGARFVVTPVDARGHRHSCSDSGPKSEWLERAWLDGDWLVVDPLTGPPQRLSVAAAG